VRKRDFYVKNSVFIGIKGIENTQGLWSKNFDTSSFLTKIFCIHLFYLFLADAPRTPIRLFFNFFTTSCLSSNEKKDGICIVQDHLYLISFIEISTISNVFGYGEYFLIVLEKVEIFLKNCFLGIIIHWSPKNQFFKKFSTFSKNYQKMFIIAKSGEKSKF
jgi:hypothetical protein